MSTVEYVFTGGVLRPGDLWTGELLAAESWLVHEGGVRGLHWHRRRFQRVCAATGHDDPGPFWSSMVTALPTTGAWFPRAELTPNGTFQLRVRPAPPLGQTIRIHRADHPDVRTQPRRKGPDLPLLNNIREKARAAGADETLLVDGGGYVLESTTAAVVWWEDDILCVPDDELPVLDSVTVKVVLEHAHAIGTPVGRRRRKPHELADKETWLLNALHGLRPVVSWPGPAAPAPRAPYWQQVLESLRSPLPGSQKGTS
ncbi:aminotransferase class IV [Actinokineospora inagensis]|uniref:aminotransferase class IV n=1 Tax=Actinokineospora inagensis TaxID=103730 RepID=UPI0004187194|nr:aminotransferase class IV [Actinokineospora inagensis]